MEALPRAAVLQPMAEVLLEKMVREDCHISTPGLQLRSVAMQEGFEHWIAGAPALLPCVLVLPARANLKGPTALPVPFCQNGYILLHGHHLCPAVI